MKYTKDTFIFLLSGQKTTHYSSQSKLLKLQHFTVLLLTGSWSNVEQLIVKVTEGLSSVPDQTLRTNLEESLSLVKG